MRFASCVGLFGLPRFLHMDIWISKIHRLTLDPTGFVKSHAAARVQKDFGVTLTPIGEHNQQSQGQHNNDWRFRPVTRTPNHQWPGRLRWKYQAPPLTWDIAKAMPSATFNQKFVSGREASPWRYFTRLIAGCFFGSSPCRAENHTC